ncbi:MAG: DUF364 domain-containing protein [Anaerolineaceae bacterium]|nr:DUF364 domain-containing protein [Anaerolineaceae bacterium]
MGNPWALYDSLLDGIDSSLIVDHYGHGVGWTEVWAGSNTGVAMTVKERGVGDSYHGPIIGRPLQDVAALIKSWNFLEASLGAAALTCYYNSIEKVQALGGLQGIDLANLRTESRRRKDALIAFQNEITGKKVAMIGHFPNIEHQFMDRCELTILERNPLRGDYPDSACEYLIAEQDYLFITGMTLTNKTLPRLLQLAGEKVKVSMLGPSVCMAPQLFSFGVDNLSGYCVTDRMLVDEAIRRVDDFAIFDAGVMVSVDKQA